MTYIKKYGLRLLYTILSLLISILFLTTLYHYNLINQTTYNILKIIIILTNIFISSFILGQKTKIKGYLEGIKFSLIIIPLFIIIALILDLTIRIRIIIYYIIIFITSTLGSMIGINTKKNKKL